jgi:hypothetical protein
MHLETLNGQPASILGLAGRPGMDTSCAAVAFEAGVNYFFFYELSHENLLNGLKPIVATHCEQVLIAADCYRYALHQKAVYLALA